MVTIWSQIIFNVMPELDFGEEEDNDLHKVYPEVPPLEGMCFSQLSTNFLFQ